MNDEIRTIELFVRAWRRARRAIGRYTRPTEIRQRLSEYRDAWTATPMHLGFAALFRSQRSRNVGDYLMRLCDIARDGQIFDVDPDYYRFFDSAFDAEEGKTTHE